MTPRKSKKESSAFLKKSAQKTFGKRVLGGLAATGVVAAGACAQGDDGWVIVKTQTMHRISGRYVQRDFGFSVAAPPDGTAYVSNGDNADAGVRIILGNHREINVYAEYIGPGLTQPEPKPCDASQLPFPTGQRLNLKMVTLGVLVGCEVPGMAYGSFWDIIQATRSDRGTDIMYTVELQTTARKARQDQGAFANVAQNFRLERIEP